MITKTLSAGIVFFITMLLMVPAVSAEKNPDLSGLEGKWKVVSSTEPDRTGYAPGAVFDVKIDKGTISTKTGIMAGVSTTTQFIAYMNVSNAGEDLGMGAFCVQMYPDKPDSFEIYLGYPKPLFWHLDSYPCVLGQEVSNTQPDDTRSGFDINFEKYYLRIKLTGEGKAHALLYYESSAAILAAEEKKIKEFGTKLTPVCNKGVCYLGRTYGTGIVELEFEKQG